MKLVRMERSVVLRAVAVVVLGLGAKAGWGSVLFDTAPTGGDGGGIIVTDGRFVAQPFRLTQDSDVSGLTWVLSGNNGGQSTMSLVALDGPPAFFPFGQAFPNPARVIASGDFSVSGSNVPVSVNWAGGPARVSAGWYAAVVTNRNPTFFSLQANAKTNFAPGVSYPVTGSVTSGASGFAATALQLQVNGTAAPTTVDPTAFRFESASRASDYNSTTDLNNLRYYGAEFTVTQPTVITQLGALLGNGGGSVFVALTKTDNYRGVLPKDDVVSSVIASVLVDASGGVSDRVGTLATPVVVEPGTYSVLVGSGKLGATGSGQLPYNLDLVNPSSRFISWVGEYSYFFGDVPQHPRVFAVGSAVVPEVSGVGVVGVLMGVGVMGRRKR